MFGDHWEKLAIKIRISHRALSERLRRAHVSRVKNVSISGVQDHDDTLYLPSSLQLSTESRQTLGSECYRIFFLPVHSARCVVDICSTFIAEVSK